MDKTLKMVAFGAVGALSVTMAAATVVQKLSIGADPYHSWWFLALWGLAAGAGLALLLKKRSWHRPTVFFLHLSFAFMLAGALVTQLWGHRGVAHLRLGADPSVECWLSEDERGELPFALVLEGFSVDYYKGTSTAMDYRSTFSIHESDGQVTEAVVSMNNIFRYKGWRFYQSGYDDDGKGTILALSSDRWGIALTYFGYALMLISFLFFFAGRNSVFRAALKRVATACLSLLIFTASIWTSPAEAKSATPMVASSRAKAVKVLPANAADAYGQLYVYYNGRVCPMQTLARDFCMKLSGKPNYKGNSAEQFLMGWIFRFDAWRNEPCIKVKDRQIREILGLEGAYASLNQLYTANNIYKLSSEYLREDAPIKRRSVQDVDEKVSLISSVVGGSFLKVFPYKSGPEKLEWFSGVDSLPMDMPGDEWLFIRKVFNLVQESVARERYEEIQPVLEKVRLYQIKTAGRDNLPSETKFKTEKLYNILGRPMAAAMVAVTLGIVFFILACLGLSWKPVRVGAWLLSFAGLVYLSLVIGLRWISSGHLPLANGHEIMMSIAWVGVLAVCLLGRKFPLSVPFGYLLCGFALLVASIGESNPQITQLMPVLASPFLSIHVACMMLSYSLLGLTMFNSLMALMMKSRRRAMMDTSLVLLYPAVFFLAAGTFLGAVWANVSWGTYWSWDPKETWALITLLVYSMTLHGSQIKIFRRPGFFHAYCVAAFLCVLITYFGVNFVLGGMHSYA